MCTIYSLYVCICDKYDIYTIKGLRYGFDVRKEAEPISARVFFGVL